MARWSLGFVIVVATLAGACGGSTPAPTSPTDRGPSEVEITLTPGQASPVAGTSLSLQFVGVTSDSRCPADAFCVQLGEAVAAFEAVLARQPGVRFELRTTEAASIGRVGAYEIALVAVQPYPFGSKPPIASADYRATVRISSQ